MIAARRLPFIEDVVAMYDYLRDQPNGVHVAVILMALGYFVMPADAVPDLIPVVGWADDATVIATAVATLGAALDTYRSGTDRQEG